MGKVFTFDEAKQEFDYILTDYREVRQADLDYISSEGSEWRSEIQLLSSDSRDKILLALGEYQPLSYAVLEEYASEYMVGFKWWRWPPNPAIPKNRMSHHGFFEVKGRVIWASLKIDVADKSCFPLWMQESWLKHLGGWGMTDGSTPMHPRMLVGGTTYWLSFCHYLSMLDKEWEKTLLPILQEQLPNVYREDGWPQFRCFLNSRLPDDDCLEGDQLYIMDGTQDGKVYWIKDSDYKNIYYLENSAEAIDAYSAHVLLQKEGRFDFSPWAKRL